MDFLQEHTLYVVGIIAAVIWLGIFVFVNQLNSKVKKLEQTER